MKKLSLAIAVLASLANIGSAFAQGYPSRPITLVVPVAAGGAVDSVARILAERLQERLRQSVVVENRPGAGALIGINSVVKAAPDGYTLLLMEPAAALAKWLHKNVQLDIANDLLPIAMIATAPPVLFSHTSLAANNAKELIAYSKTNPGKLSVGTAGVGTPLHLAALMFNAAAQVDITHVSYRGGAPALNDLLGGQIPLIWATPVAVMPFLEQGKVKALGVGTARRSSMLPQVPSISENALPGFDVDIWLGIAAPGKTPIEVVTRLEQAVREISELAAVQVRMSALGFKMDFRNGDNFRELVIKDHHKYGAVIRDAAIQLD
jgi:tripartite-type tricarboxylate transporter receptor subunit TctC